jgi:methyl-accepting chemotaxis protein
MRMKAVMDRLARLGIAPRLLATAIFLIVVAIAASTILSMWTAQRAVFAQGQAHLDDNMRVAWELLAAKGAARIDGEKLKFGDLVVNGDSEIVGKVKTLVGGTATIFMGDTRVATNVTKADGTRAVGTKLAPGPAHDAVFKEKRPYRGEVDIVGTAYFAAYDPIKNDKGEVIGILYTGVPKAEFLAVVYDMGTSNAIAAVVIVLLSAGVLLFDVRKVLNPLELLRDAMAKLSAGELATPVPGTHRHDEIGLMAQEIEIFRQAALAKEKLEAEQAAERLRQQRRAATIEGSIAVFDKSMGVALDALAAAATQMRTTAKDMSVTAAETSAQATTVAAATEQASANVQTVAAATEELSSSVAEIGRQVTQSTRIAGQAVTEADRTNTTVQGLSAAAQKIGDVVSLISDIASQTNLLALNATIEAARAGEAGKGFAVVASEVKSLANQTAKATEEIAGQVAAMQGATVEAVEAIKRIGGTIGSINEIATTIASAVEEQGAATQEIARNVQEAAQGTGQVSSNIVGVNQAASETGAASSQVLASAEELGRQAERLRADVDSFLAEIRAA